MLNNFFELWATYHSLEVFALKSMHNATIILIRDICFPWTHYTSP